jgi:hypothetical protein
MTHTILSTAALARILNQPYKRVDNDIQLGYLPIEKGIGRGRSRTYEIEDARRCAIYYELRDSLGIAAGIARDLLPSMLWLHEGSDTLCAVYRYGEAWHAEMTFVPNLFDGGAFKVFPKGAEVTIDAVTLLNMSSIVRRVDAAVAAEAPVK